MFVLVLWIFFLYQNVLNDNYQTLQSTKQNKIDINNLVEGSFVVVGDNLKLVDKLNSMDIIISNKQNTINSSNLLNSNLINTSGNVGIAKTNPTAKLHIEHSSTSTSPANGGLYVYNPTNAINNTSTIGTRIGGSTALRALFSLDVFNAYGWSMFIAGDDTSLSHERPELVLSRWV